MSTDRGTMSRFRFSISGLLALVALCGVMFAALRTHSGIWPLVTVVILVCAVLTALLGALFLRGRRRAFCAGFALFGGTFLVLFHLNWFLWHYSLIGIVHLYQFIALIDPATGRDGRLLCDLGIADYRVQIAVLEIIFVLAISGGIIGAAFAAWTESRRAS